LADFFFLIFKNKYKILVPMNINGSLLAIYFWKLFSVKECESERMQPVTVDI
jgi:hypothetical protein